MQDQAKPAGVPIQQREQKKEPEPIQEIKKDVSPKSKAL